VAVRGSIEEGAAPAPGKSKFLSLIAIIAPGKSKFLSFGFLNRNGCKTIGVDLSEDLLDLAQSQLGEFIYADMVDYLQKTPKPKDLLICIGNTLPHLEPNTFKDSLEHIPGWLNQDGLLPAGRPSKRPGVEAKDPVAAPCQGYPENVD